MHLLRCHAALPLLLPLLLASVVVVLVEASTAAFLSRNLRSSLTKASKQQVRDANTILLERSVNLPFGLLVRGGHTDNGESTQIENDEGTKVDPTAEVCNNEEIASSERHKSAWEEEIKRTQSFYLAESENRSKSNQHKVDVEDVRAYGSSQIITPTLTGGDKLDSSADMGEVIVEAFDTKTFDTETCDKDIGSTEVDAQHASELQGAENEKVANVVEEEILDKEVVDEEQSTIVEEETSADNEESSSSSILPVLEIEEEITLNEVSGGTGDKARAEILNTDILDEENEEKVAAEEQSTIASAYDDYAGASVDVKDNDVDKIDEDALSEEEVVDDNGESRASDFVEYTTDIATDMNEDNTPLLRKVNDLMQVLLLRGRMSIHRKVSKVVTIVSQDKPQIAAVFAA